MIPVKNLAYLTENFRALQGLRLIPVGLFFLITSATQFHWIPVWEGDQTFTLLVALIAILANIFIGKYYARTYGTVKKRETTFQRDMLIGLSFVVLIIFFCGSRIRHIYKFIFWDWSSLIIASCIGGFKKESRRNII